jgi:hypothetical protein
MILSRVIFLDHSPSRLTQNASWQICYDRKLFHVEENEPGDSDNHYPFLWTDL